MYLITRQFGNPGLLVTAIFIVEKLIRTSEYGPFIQMKKFDSDYNGLSLSCNFFKKIGHIG
jgi:hypothetical protein